MTENEILIEQSKHKLSRMWDSRKKIDYTNPDLGTEKYDPVMFPPLPAKELVYVTYDYVKERLYKDMLFEIKQQGKTWAWDNENTLKAQSIISAALHYKNNPLNLDPYKWTFLLGPNSTGKSTFMRNLCKVITSASWSNPENVESITICSYKALMMECRKEGKITPISALKGALYIDDLGYLDQSQLTLFGSKEDVVTELVFQIHESYKKHAHKHYFTSNLTLEHIHNTYGQGTHDRIVEMCNVIGWKGTNKRV